MSFTVLQPSSCTRACPDCPNAPRNGQTPDGSPSDLKSESREIGFVSEENMPPQGSIDTAPDVTRSECFGRTGISKLPGQ